MSDTMRLINGALVTRRRLELGLSARALGRAAGFGFATLQDIEDNDGQGRTVTLGELTRLAGALDLRPGDLINTDPAQDPDPSDAASPDDTHHVAQALWEARAVIYVDDIAQAFGWSYDRVVAALDTLQTNLHGTGLHVHRFSGRVQLRPADPVPDLTARMTHAIAARRGIDRRQAALLFSALQGLRKNGGNGEDGDKRGRPTLLLLGLLQDDGGTHITLGDDIRFALDM